MKRVHRKLISGAIRLANRLQHFAGFGFAGRASISKEVSVALTLTQNPKIIFDVGANNGDYSQEILTKLPDAEIYMFEPDAENFKRLKSKFANNQSTLVQKGVGDQQCKATLYTDKPGSGLSSLSKRRLEHHGKSLEIEESIELIRLDDFCRQHQIQKIDFLKMDIEGHELNALIGLGEFILKTKCIQFEFGGANIDSKVSFQDFYYFFSKKGFSLFRLTSLGAYPIHQYSETLENYQTTVYYAVRNSNQ